MPQGTVGVSLAQFLGARTIPGQWLKEARPELQSFTESVVGLRLVGRPPGAQTGINPSSCLGEEDCSWPATIPVLTKALLSMDGRPVIVAEGDDSAIL